MTIARLLGGVMALWGGAATLHSVANANWVVAFWSLVATVVGWQLLRTSPTDRERTNATETLHRDERRANQDYLDSLTKRAHREQRIEAALDAVGATEPPADAERSRWTDHFYDKMIDEGIGSLTDDEEAMLDRIESGDVTSHEWIPWYRDHTGDTWMLECPYPHPNADGTFATFEEMITHAETHEIECPYCHDVAFTRDTLTYHLGSGCGRRNTPVTP